MLKINGKIDKRHVVEIDNRYSLATAFVINEDDTYDRVTYMDNDDMRTWGNECIIDATDEEKEAWRKHIRKFKIGDKVKIVSGRKMLGEVKTVSKMFTYHVEGTYGHADTEYLIFDDGTKVQRRHCEIL